MASGATGRPRPSIRRTNVTTISWVGSQVDLEELRQALGDVDAPGTVTFQVTYSDRPGETGETRLTINHGTPG